ncbi:BspA family leucine-rich repeat surface protein [Mycoplasma capricolum subsp. capricolum]|uniref:BspA family leucine-rich repeat surface protein n=1 Tax=Mycoplasma capricolum TaxID=2095 RepID=UPI003DA4B1AC
MKKLLTVLGSMTLIATVGTSVIACKTTDSTISETQLAQKVKNIWNDNFKNKITSAKNYSMIIEMIKEKLNSKEKELIDLSNKEESRKRPKKWELDQKINIKVGEQKIELNFGEVKEGKKATKYKDPKTGEIKSTDATDFSKINGLKEVKEIIEIGYFEHADDHDNNKIQIRAVLMPENIEKVPDVLPKEVTSTRAMFNEAKEFNQDLSKWDTSNLESIDEMFKWAHKFNQNLSKWDVSNVRIFDYAFYGTKAFDQDLSDWDVSNGQSMKRMFARSEKYNNGGKALTWNEKTKNVKDMSTMFALNHVFNQDISKWDVSNVTDMTQMFLQAKQFNQDLNNWNVGNVKKMRSMFRETEKFNKPLNKWDVSKVEDMGNMFMKTKEFDQDISMWNISKLNNIEAIFLDAEKFNQNLSSWNTKHIKTYAGYHNGAKAWKEENKLKFNNTSNSTQAPKKK